MRTTLNHLSMSTRSQRCCHCELLSSWAMFQTEEKTMSTKMGFLMRGLRLSLESCRTVFQGSYLLVWHPGATSAVSDPCWWISHKPPAEALPLRLPEQTKQAEQTLDWRRMEILVRGSCVRKLPRFFRVLQQCREFVQCSSNVDILRVYVVHFVRDLHSHSSVQICSDISCLSEIYSVHPFPSV